MLKNMKKVDPIVLIDGWLKYHNTSYAQVLKENPEWEVNPHEHTREFLNKYKVTQEQHDQWEEWAKAYCKKVTKCTKSYLNRAWGLTYLNVAPMIRK
jgi:hypothetical protein